MVFLEIKNNNWRVIVVELVNMFNRLILLLLWGIKWRRKINLWGNLWNIRNLMGIFWDIGCRIKMLIRLVFQGYDQCFIFCFIFIYVFLQLSDISILLLDFPEVLFLDLLLQPFLLLTQLLLLVMSNFLQLSLQLINFVLEKYSVELGFFVWLYYRLKCHLLLLVLLCFYLLQLFLLDTQIHRFFVKLIL